MQKDGIVIGLIPGGKRKVKADFRKIIEVVFKTGIMAASGNWYNATKEFSGIISTFKTPKTAPEIAYYFILEALVNTAHSLIEENIWRFREYTPNHKSLIDSDEYVQFLDSISELLEDEIIKLGPEFIKDPKSLSILPEFQIHFKKALQIFKIPHHDIAPIVNRLPVYFVFEINDAWRKNSAHYSKLLSKLSTPFDDAVARELQWGAYRAYLDRETDLPVFEEAFSLKDIFIQLRAYHTEKEKLHKRLDTHQPHSQKTKKRVVWLEESLNKWLEHKKTSNEIRMISGGPGSGKSSFAKMWAAKIAKTENWKVLFIPLHHFDIENNIIKAVGDFLIDTPHIPFKHNPMEAASPNEKFLLIFDGLDELVMQDKTARESAIQFIDALQKLCGRFNKGNTTTLKILIAGRPISVQNADTQTRGTQEQVIYLLPYFLTKEEQTEYSDSQKILQTDQRQDWWHRFQKFRKLSGNNMPAELINDNLDKLTREPLLNYLIALSWTFDKSKFDEQTNINEVYYTLIHGVYKRDYEKAKNINIGNLDEYQFFQILEEIAICAWHGGDVRVTSDYKIEKHIQDRGLNYLLEDYKKSVKGGVSRLLTAFYFRKYGRDEISENKDETFEFTHKSFGEYLTARALVELVNLIHQMRQKHLNNRNTRIPEGWSKKETLTEWLRITGETLFDRDLKKLVQNEIRLRAEQEPPEPIRDWQLTLCDLIAEVAETGMPFEKSERTHKEERIQSQNAEIALLILLESCASVTKETSPISWITPNSFWNWWHNLLGSFNHFVQAIDSLRYIGYKGEKEDAPNLQHANLQDANLQHANLQSANLQHAKLQHAKLQYANLQYANLQFAKLEYAKLQSAKLESAKLQYAKLQYAKLQHAHLYNANLYNAHLYNANLESAHLQNAHLQNADLEYANLQHAHLYNANLHNANLHNANLQHADLESANLEYVNLQYADLEYAKLQYAILKDAKGLTFDQLSQVHTLYKCKGIPQGLKERLEKECPQLFKNPRIL